MLHALEVFEVVALRDRFQPEIQDLDLFLQLKHSGFVFVTSDERQKTKQHEALAFKEAGITALWLGLFWSKMGFWQQAKWIVNKWDKIDGFVSGVAVGTCAEVKQNGKSYPFRL